MKKITIITLLLCSLFATMIFGGCSPGKNNDNNTTNDPATSDEESTPADNEPSEEIVPADIEVSEEMTSSDNKAEEETTRSKPLAGANGNAKSDCQEYEFRTPEGPVPKELLVTEPIKTIKYFQSVLTGDPCVADYATEEMMAKKKNVAQQYIDIVGFKEKPEISVDKYNYIEFKTDGCDFSVGLSSVSAKLDSVSIKIDASDNDIISIFKSNKYLTALAKITGINLDNVYIDRDDMLMSPGTINQCLHRSVTICNKADFPVEQAFEMEKRSIGFNLSESTERSDKRLQFSGHWITDKYIVEETLSATSYADAKKQADATVDGIIPDPSDSISNKTDVECCIIYEPTVKDYYYIPCYRFFYTTDRNHIVRVDVPCIDATKLPDTSYKA